MNFIAVAQIGILFVVCPNKASTALLANMAHTHTNTTLRWISSDIEPTKRWSKPQLQLAPETPYLSY